MKYFRFLLLFPVLFLFSCGNTYYTTEEVILNTETIYYTVPSGSWILVDNLPAPNKPDDSQQTYFFCEFREPILNNFVFNNGMMNAYIVDNGNRSIITLLPFDNYYVSPRGHAWTEHVTCEFSPQRVTFILKYNDFDVIERPPLDYTFMVRYAW